MFSGFLGMSYEFKWSVLWAQPHLTWLIDGLLTTLRLASISWCIAVLLGIIFGAMRTVPFRPVRVIATFYVEFFRNVPLLVWLFFWYFGAPEVFPEAVRQWFIRHGIEFWSAVAAVSVYHGSRFAEVIRAGIQAIPKTQLEAGLSSGLSVIQTYRLIIVPIALRLIVPPGTNESLNLLKNTSLAMTIGVAELTFAARQIETYTAKDVVFLPFPDDIINKLHGKFPYYAPVTLPAKAYPKQNNPVKTIAIISLWVTRADVDEKTIHDVTYNLFEKTPQLYREKKETASGAEMMAAAHEQGKNVTLENALLGVTIPLHVGAYKYYKEKGIKVPANLIPPEAK